ncbi:LYR motif-containing protein 2 [Coemansia sp. Benny D115]|nr:LYR motif-containing protein 2 [Coemansia sp. Benny D115]
MHVHDTIGRTILGYISTNQRPFARLISSRQAPRPQLSLQQFILRGKVLATYRKYMRLTKRIPDKPSRKEMRQWIRGDFDRYKNEADPKRIKVLLAQATRQYKEMESGMLSML